MNQDAQLAGDDCAGNLESGFSGAQYHVVCSVHGQLLASGLRSALRCLIARHEGLRVRFSCNPRHPLYSSGMHRTLFGRTGFVTPGTYVQDVVAAAEVCVNERSVSEGRYSDTGPLALGVLHNEALTPLDVRAAPRLRVTIVTGDVVTLLVLTVSHISVDRASARLLVEELDRICAGLQRGVPADLDPVSLSYSAYAKDQSARSRDATHIDLKYWERSLRRINLDGTLIKRIPAAINRTGSGSAESGIDTLSVTLSQDESLRLRTLASQLAVSTRAILRVLFTAAWSEWTGTSETAIWCSLRNRHNPKQKTLVAWCSTAHMLPFNVDRKVGFARLCLRMCAALDEAERHSDVHIQAVWRQLGKNPYAGEARVAFEYQVFPPARSFQTLHPLLITTPAAFVDLTLRVDERETGFTFVLLFDRGRYDPGRCQRMLFQLRAALRQACGDPHAAFLHLWNPTQ